MKDNQEQDKKYVVTYDNGTGYMEFAHTPCSREEAEKNVEQDGDKIIAVVLNPQTNIWEEVKS